MKTLIVITDTARYEVQCESMFFADGCVLARVKDEVIACFQSVGASWFDGTTKVQPFQKQKAANELIKEWTNRCETTASKLSASEGE